MPELVPARPAPGEDWWTDDAALSALLAARLPAAVMKEAEPRLLALGAAAPATLDALAREADRERPRLDGTRPRDVRFHPSYEALRRAAREHEVFTLAWRPFAGLPRAPRTVGFALGYLYAQAECGYYCPACMTDGAAFVLTRHAAPALRDAWVPRLVARDAEGAAEGAMYLTERGGGSDVGGGTATTATPADDGTWRLTGEKWFASNCTAEAALALARVPDGPAGTEGLGLFLVPRDLAGGRPNPGLAIRRLKDKLGVTSMATGEVVLDGAVAHLVAGPGQGFRAMAEMVNLSRLYNAVASVALARRALREGLRAARAREAFGKPLADHPLFARGLLAVAVETEAALAATLDVAEVFDAAEDAERAGDDEAARRARTLLRVLTPAAKGATARLAVRAASEACEWLGGVGYTEEYVTPRLLRDAQVLPIWEGTTNVQALELVKALGREGALAELAAHVKRCQATVSSARLLPAIEAQGRALTRLQKEAARLEAGPAAEREVASLRLLETVFAVHAGACLARAAASSPRLQRMTALHAGTALAPDRDEAARALERAAASGEAKALLFGS